MNKGHGEIIMLGNKFKKQDVLNELGKARRKGYKFFYCSYNVYHSMVMNKESNPYEEKKVEIVMGFYTFPNDKLWDNVMMFSKLDIYKNPMPCAVQK